MKRFIPLSVMALLMLVSLTIVSPTNANAQGAGLVSSVLSRLEKNRQTLKTLRAGISMEKYNSQLRDSDTFQGMVIYVPGSGRQASVRIDWTRPRQEILAVNNGRYTIYRPNQKIVYTGNSNSKANKAGGVLEMMYMTRQQLEARFEPVKDVREETLWGGISTIHLTLVPKGNSSYKYAEIWIDNSGMPVQTKVVEKNDDSTTMRLTGLEKNIKINPDDFNVKYDGDVKVVKS
jgi:outer membrane lipoprotein-sorting protein